MHLSMFSQLSIHVRVLPPEVKKKDGQGEDENSPCSSQILQSDSSKQLKFLAKIHVEPNGHCG